MALALSTTVAKIYLVPAISGTIDQLVPQSKSHRDETTTNHQRPRHNDQLWYIAEYCNDDTRDAFREPNDYCAYVNESGDPPTLYCFVGVAEDLRFKAVAVKADPDEVVFPVVKDAELLDATSLKGNVMRVVWKTTKPSHAIFF